MAIDQGGLSAKVWESKQVVFKEGDESDGTMYYVLEGSFGIYKKLGGKQSEVQKIGPGHFFGEMALVNRVPRAASIICTSELAKTVRIDRDAFLTLGKSKPEFLFKLLQAVLQRIVNAHTLIHEKKQDNDPFQLG